MPQIWEVMYDGDSSDFFATKAEAVHSIRQGNNEATLLRHEYEPTQAGIAKLLNHVANQAG